MPPPCPLPCDYGLIVYYTDRHGTRLVSSDGLFRLLQPTDPAEPGDREPRQCRLERVDIQMHTMTQRNNEMAARVKITLYTQCFMPTWQRPQRQVPPGRPKPPSCTGISLPPRYFRRNTLGGTSSADPARTRQPQSGADPDCGTKPDLPRPNLAGKPSAH